MSEEPKRGQDVWFEINGEVYEGVLWEIDGIWAKVYLGNCNWHRVALSSLALMSDNKDADSPAS